MELFNNDLIDISVKDISQLGFGNHSFLKVPSLIPDSKFDVIKSDGNEITKNLYGINHRQTPSAMPANRDNYGLTFFTRPQLNLRTDNLRQSRQMSKLLTEQELSIFRFVRNTLDPRLDSSYGEGIRGIERISCKLVDPYQAFIPILTNTLVNISGWPDIRLDTYTSKAGPYKEEWSMVDSQSENYSAYDLTATFRSVKGDPVLNTMFYWQHYTAKVFEGILSPYPDFLINNEIDYNTRIYRLILDPTKRYVTQMACCGAAFPYAGPFSTIFDFNAGKPYHDGTSEQQFPFKCNGVWYNDDIIIRAFNTTVGYFNPEMRVKDITTDKPSLAMKKVPMQYLSIFNHKGYPRIDPYTRELEWYVRAEVYAAKIASFIEFDKRLDRALGFAAQFGYDEQEDASERLTT